MRHEADKLTYELPGIEQPLERLKKAEKQKVMGYHGPKERPRCETCKFCAPYYLMPDTAFQLERFACMVGNFRTHRGSICNRFEEKFSR